MWELQTIFSKLKLFYIPGPFPSFQVFSYKLITDKFAKSFCWNDFRPHVAQVAFLSFQVKGLGYFGKKGCFAVFNMTQDTGRIRELKNNTAICDYSEHVKAVCLKAFRALIKVSEL